MNEFIEKLIGRLEELANYNGNAYLDSADVFDEIKELAEEYKINTIIDGQYCWQTCGATEHCKECNRLCNGSIDYYENYDSLAEECNDGWIHCDKEVPEVNLRVLLSLVTGDVWMGSFDGYKYDLIGLGYVTNSSVLAWQPLPHKYEPKGE